MAAVPCSSGKLCYPLHGLSLTHETHRNIVADNQPHHSNSTSWIRILSPLAHSDLNLELFVLPLSSEQFLWCEGAHCAACGPKS